MSSFRQLMMRNKGGGNIIYAPTLDGTEQITVMSGKPSPTISNNTMSGGSGYLSQGWNNTILWKLTVEATASGDCGVIIHVSTNNYRDNNLFQLTSASDVYIYNGSYATVANDQFFKTQDANNRLDSGWKTITYEKVSSTQIKVTINGYSKTWTWGFLADYNTINIGVDSWGGTASIRNIVVTKA